jgi:hypothetical protein
MINAGKAIFFLTFFALLVQSLIFFDRAEEMFALPLVLILAGIAGFSLARQIGDPDNDLQVNIFLWAFSARLWMGMILYGWDLKEMFGDEDASGYTIGWRFADNWWTNGLDGFASDLTLVFFDQQNIGQGLIWAIPTFFAGGESRMTVSVVNSFAGALLVIVVFKLARRIFGTETAKITALLATFWLSFILLSAGTSKEMLVIFFEWTLLYLLVRDPKGLSVKDGILAVPALLAVFISRFYALYLLAAAVVFRFLIARKEHIFRNLIFGSMLVVSLMIFLNAGGAIERDYERIDRLNQRIDAWRENVATYSGTGVEVYSQYETTAVAVPVATIYFFFAPFPWEMFSGTARNTFGAVENIFVVLMLIIGFPGLKVLFRDRIVEMAPIFVFCVLYSGMHIWGLSNIGLAWRHKQTIMPLFFMLVAVAITHRHAGWQAITGRARRREGRLSVVPSAR